MNQRIIRLMVVGAAIVAPVLGSVGCSREVAHSESDKPGWFGGSTHEEKTVYKNSDGTMSTETQKSHVDN